jgi:hypothetical protein
MTGGFWVADNAFGNLAGDQSRINAPRFALAPILNSALSVIAPVRYWSKISPFQF